MEPAIVIAPYRCKTENQEKLFEVLKDKRKYFLEAGYVTERKPILMRSRKDKEVILEIFEWTSDKHTNDAHKDPKVLDYWGKMDKLCTAIGFPLREISEADESFAHFDPLNIYY
ncbi:MAG: hypothetical protein M3R36_10825 [Bacteroidota bacterium]|nr:hypothetical protein [Bacteroidota bacterium]